MTRFDTLQLVAAALTLAGLVVLYAAATVFAPPSIPVSDISYGHTGNFIETEGVVTSYRYTPDAQFLTLESDSARISGVSFRSEPLSIEENQKYRIGGRVEVYQGDLELIIHDVTRVTE